MTADRRLYAALVRGDALSPDEASALVGELVAEAERDTRAQIARDLRDFGKRLAPGGSLSWGQAVQIALHGLYARRSSRETVR